MKRAKELKKKAKIALVCIGHVRHAQIDATMLWRKPFDCSILNERTKTHPQSRTEKDRKKGEKHIHKSAKRQKNSAAARNNIELKCTGEKSCGQIQWCLKCDQKKRNINLFWILMRTFERIRCMWQVHWYYYFLFAEVLIYLHTNEWQKESFTPANNAKK